MRAFRLFSVLPLSILAVAATCRLTPSSSPSGQPAAGGGVLDLEHWDFQKNGSLSLGGPWIFHPAKLATDGARLTAVGNQMLGRPRPGSVSADAQRTDHHFQTLPHIWNRPFPFGAGVQAVRYGTYILYLDNLKGKETLAVRQARTHSSFRLWVVSKKGRLRLIGSAGSVGVGLGRAEPAMRRTVGSFKAQDASALVFEVSDFWTERGGPWEPLVLGSAHEIRTEEAGARSWAYWFMGFLFVMGVYHLILFSIRRTLLSALFLGLSCFSVIVYAYVWGDFFQTDHPTVQAFAITWKLRYAMYPMMALTAISYAIAILEAYRWKHWRRIVFSYNLAAIPLMLAAPPSFLTHYQIIFDFGVFLAIVYGIALPYHSLWVGAAEDRAMTALLAGSATLLGLCAGSDVLMTYAVHDGPRLFQYAAAVWMLAQAYIIAVRFERSRAVAESMSVELKKIDMLKDEFLANTSHELRTPLHGITGIVESLLSGIAGPLDEMMRSNLSLVAASGRRLSGLVNDILDISKLNHGEIVLRRRALDLSALIRVVVELSRPLIRQDGVRLVYEETERPTVYADEDRLQQILFNLVGNAIKFTASGRITLSLRAPGQSAGPEDFVEVRVADTGIGIPADKQELIFETFRQADGSIAREYEGTGLGLSITKHLIELHGGTISVESAVGVGAVFTFTLPVSAELPVTSSTASLLAARSSGLPHPKEPGPLSGREQPTPPIPGTALHALIVDDDPVNLQVLRNHLSLEGFLVTEARGGREALDCFVEDHSFDIVLLDVMMPQMSGFEVCRQLRLSHSRSELPIMMLTAKNRISDLVTGLSCGANDYLAKPFDSEELRARVRILVELKRAARSQSDLAALHGELELARRIQLSLLPAAAPLVPGLKVAGRYRAMERVGGDFYTYNASPDHLGVLLTDVSGHGVPAALIVSMVHLAFSFQSQTLSTPGALLESMNRILYGNIGTEFITGCYAYLDLNARVLSVGNAGHPPLLLWRRGEGTIESIRPKGRILGLLPDTVFATSEIEIQSGDRLLLYTDGALEATDRARRVFGDEGLRQVLADGDHLDAEQFADHLIELLVGWSGGAEHIDDDIAIVVVDVS